MAKIRFEKTYHHNGCKVEIDDNIIALYDLQGNLLTNANADYYFSPEGYNCESYLAAADLFVVNRPTETKR